MELLKYNTMSHRCPKNLPRWLWCKKCLRGGNCTLYWSGLTDSVDKWVVYKEGLSDKILEIDRFEIEMRASRGLLTSKILEKWRYPEGWKATDCGCATMH